LLLSFQLKIRRLYYRSWIILIAQCSRCPDRNLDVNRISF
jgi:hypothetical protein